MPNPYPIFINSSPADALAVQYSRVSLPLARGAFQEMPPVEIRNAAGEAMAVQSELLTRWPDGSPRMLHLTLRGDAGRYEAVAGGSESTPAVEDAIALQENNEDASVAVTTGRLTARIGGRKLIHFVRLGEHEMLGADGLEVLVTDGQGRVFTAGAAREIETTVETSGPLRTVVAVRGQSTLDEETFLDFRLRFEFLAGVEGFSLSYTFFNLQRGQDFWPVRSIELKLQMAQAGAPEYSVCQQQHGLFGLPRVASTAKPLQIVVDDTQSQSYLRNFEALGDETEYPFYLDPPPHNVDNWALIRSEDKRALLVEMDDFHFLRPKTLHLENGAARFGIWPSETGVLELQQGRSRQITIRVALLDAEATPTREQAQARIAQLAEVWRAQLPHAVYAEAEFFDQSRVLPFAPLEHPRFERWLGGMSTHLNSVATFFDLGDTPDSGYRRTYTPLGRQRRIRSDDGGQRWFSAPGHVALEMNALEDFEPVWVNNEYDVIFAIGTEYLRTGDLSLLQKLRWFSRHTIDVDFLHYSDHKWMHRAQPAHSARHTTTGAYPSHFWTQGLAQYYMLTADPDALEVIIALADKTIENLDDPELGKLHGGLNREVGWGILTLVCAYEASGEKRFDDYARKLLDEGSALGLPPDIPVFSFGHTSLMLSIRQYLELHKEETLQDLKNWFLAFIDLAIDCSRSAPASASSPGKSKTAGNYSYDNELAARGQMNAAARTGIFEARSIAFDSLAYAHEISGDKKYIEAGLLSLEAMIDSPIFRHPVPEGKPYAMTHRSWINYLQAAAKLGYLDEWEWEYRSPNPPTA